MSDPLTLVALVEAVLAVAGEPVGVDALVAAAGEETAREEVEAALEVLRERYDRPGSGLVVEAAGGGFRLATRPQHEAALRGFLGVRSRTRLSQAALETLAIVAYRQPVTLPEINFLRGVNSAGVLRTLVDKRLLRVAGRKAVVGTPLLYRTSKEFLVRFGLESLAALPPVEQVVEETGEQSGGA